VNEFKREDRYIVIKRSDVDNFWRDNVREQFMAALKRLNEHHVRIPQRQYVVVESDWPEYETVWRMIEARMTGAPVPPVGGELEIRKIVTESLLGMISAVVSATPPADQPLPDFIQSPIDRAVTRIVAHVTRLHADLGRLDSFKTAYSEWMEKTEWVQATVRDLGKHRADVIFEQFHALQSELIKARQAASEVKRIGFGVIGSSGKKRAEYLLRLDPALRSLANQSAPAKTDARMIGTTPTPPMEYDEP